MSGRLPAGYFGGPVKAGGGQAGVEAIRLALGQAILSAIPDAVDPN